jgi:hypothetical protein
MLLMLDGNRHHRLQQAYSLQLALRTLGGNCGGDGNTAISLPLSPTNLLLALCQRCAVGGLCCWQSFCTNIARHTFSTHGVLVSARSSSIAALSSTIFLLAVLLLLQWP